MKSLLIVALLAVGAFAVAVPAPVFASAGHSNIVASTDQQFPFSNPNIPATFNVTATWGSALLSAVDSVPLVGTYYFVLDLSGVVFNGAQFSLWLSPNGFSNINQTAGSGDIPVTQVFNVSSLSGPALHVGNYWLGTDVDPFISGPVTGTSTDIPGGIYYMKVFDGTSTSVAVSSQFIILLPSITLKPISLGPAAFGPAGSDMIVTGHGFTAGGIVNISIQAPLGTWFGTANITAGPLGNFSVSIASLGFRIPDLQNGASSFVPNNVTTDIEAVAYDYSTGQSAQAQFVEAYRELYWLQANRTATTLGDELPVADGPYTNLTDQFGNPGDNPAIIDGWVLQNLWVSGLFFNPTNPTPTFKWDGNVITPTHLTPINATGYFDANFTIPVTGLGTHFLWIFDKTNNFTVQVNVMTTLIINPTQGPEGTTVTVTGYGFTAGGNVTVYWWGTELTTPVDQGVDYLLLYRQNNMSTGSFNFTFVVPSGVYGGSHDIFANDTGGVWAIGTFFVTPTWGLSANSGALGSKFFVLGHGLPVGSSTYETSTVLIFENGNDDSTGADAYAYQLTYDNVWAEYPASYNGLDFGLSGDDTGEANYTMVAAGVPMTHYVGLVRSDVGTYELDGSFAFLVTGNTTGDQQILTAIAGQTASLAGLQSSMTSLSTSIASLTTTVNAIQASSSANGAALTALAASQTSSFASLNSAVSTLSTSVNNGFTGVNSAITSLGSSVNTGFSSLTTAVGGVTTTVGGKVDAVGQSVTTLTSSVSALSGKVDAVSSKVDTITTTTTTINNATASLSTITTVLYIAVILAAIAVVLELVLLIRKR